MRFAAVILSAALAAGATPARAADVIVTDCTAPPVVQAGRSTLLDVGSDDLILRCALMPLPGTGRIRVQGNRITIDGPAGGISSPSKGWAIDVRARADITVANASLEASNGNGSLRLVSQTGLDIRNSVLTTGLGDKAGRRLLLQCRDDGCPLTLLDSNLLGHFVKFQIKGPIFAVQNTVVTRGPRDSIDVRSFGADAQLCCDLFNGHREGNVYIKAADRIDLRNTTVTTGEDIKIMSGLGGIGETVLLGATLDNDFGKRGEIEVTAARGASQIDIQDATLVDDDVHAPGDVSELNGRETVPHEGFNNTVGTPQTDS